jgi:hypothetical protein
MLKIDSFVPRRATADAPHQYTIEETNSLQVLSEQRDIRALDEIAGIPLGLQRVTQNSDNTLDLFTPNAGPTLYEDVHQKQYDLINDYENQVYIDPLSGMNHGALEGYMAQFNKIQQMIKDQIVHGDMKTTRQGTWPYGVDITTTYDDNGNTTGKLWKHDNGYSAYTNSDGEVTYKDSNGNEITHDEYQEGSGSWLQTAWEWSTGGQGNSNITAETDVWLGSFIESHSNLSSNRALETLVNEGQNSEILIAENLFITEQMF